MNGSLNRLAWSATLHCLTGCAIGEVLGMVIGTAEEGRIERAGRFTRVACELGVAPATLAIAWCLKNPHVSSVILGATTPAQLSHNLHALAIVPQLDEGLQQRIEAAFL